MKQCNMKSLNYRGRLVELHRPLVMGILNITPDSFYAGSRTFDAEAAEQHVRQMVADGVDIIDVGGYSTRPGADDVCPDEEYTRLARGLEVVRRAAPECMLSVDTFRADVARRCVEDWGVGIINDVGGGTLDPEIWDVAAATGSVYVLMHLRGTPATMKQLTQYDDVVADVLHYLVEKAHQLNEKGVADVILDPGFGFAKDVEQNFRLLDNLDLFCKTPYPVLAGMSHKTMIWKTLNTTAENAKNGTVVLDTIALMKGADIVRVHDVAEAVETVRLIEKMRSSAGDE